MSKSVRTAAHVVSILALAVAGGLALTGCGGGGDGGEGARGTLKVSITDQSSLYAEVHIAIEEVRVVPAGGGQESTIATFDPPRDVEILALSFQQELLGQALIPAGDYNQVRLVLAPNPAGGDPVNYLTLLSDPATKIPLRTPSGQQSGLKVVGQFQVVAEESNAILLDFNPDKAIVQAGNSGNYNLKPTGIRIVTTEGLPATFGGLIGTVDPDTAWQTAVVEAIPVSGTLPVASTTVDPLDGSFRLLVPAGDYNLRVSADGFTTTDFGPFTVVAGADTDAEVLTLP